MRAPAYPSSPKNATSCGATTAATMNPRLSSVALTACLNKRNFRAGYSALGCTEVADSVRLWDNSRLRIQMVRIGTIEIRRARLADVEEIAAAHVDSILTIGARYYEPATVSDWCARVNGDLYVKAMAQREVFFIAIGPVGDKSGVLGFSSHRADGKKHGVAVYVRAQSARQGIGSALFRTAEASAIAAGATSIHVDSSLAAVDFYRANGFEEVGRGEHRLWSGRTMACVFMQKILAQI
jgi:GNAT superfamily N-acetyltransferase